jgi:hypothetical protein
MKTRCGLLLLSFFLCASVRAGISASGSSSSFSHGGVLYPGDPVVTSTINIGGLSPAELLSYTLTLTFAHQDNDPVPPSDPHYAPNTYYGDGIPGTLILTPSLSGPWVKSFAVASDLTHDLSGLNYSATFSSSTLFDAGSGSGPFDPNGIWTLSFANIVGDYNTITGWSLNVTAVPEPANVALSIFGGLFSLVLVGRSRTVRGHLQRCRAAVEQWLDAA